MPDLVQELTAGVPHWEDLQQVGHTEQALRIVLGDADLPGVGVVNQARNHAGLHPVESHHILLCLYQPSSEHSLEVRGEAGEDALVHRELALVHLDLDVSKAVLPPEDVEAGEDHVGVCGAPAGCVLHCRQTRSLNIHPWIIFQFVCLSVHQYMIGHGKLSYSHLLVHSASK